MGYLDGHRFPIAEDTAEFDDRLHATDGDFDRAVDHFLPTFSR